MKDSALGGGPAAVIAFLTGGGFDEVAKGAAAAVAAAAALFAVFCAFFESCTTVPSDVPSAVSGAAGRREPAGFFGVGMSPATVSDAMRSAFVIAVVMALRSMRT